MLRPESWVFTEIFGWLVTRNKFRGKDVYIIIEIQFQTEEYPGLPQYYHEYVLLAPIKVYAEWSEAQKMEAIQAIYEQKEKEFRNKYGSESS